MYVKWEEIHRQADKNIACLWTLLGLISMKIVVRLHQAWNNSLILGYQMLNMEL